MAAPEHTTAPDRIAEARAAVDQLHHALTTLSAEQVRRHVRQAADRLLGLDIAGTRALDVTRAASPGRRDLPVIQTVPLLRCTSRTRVGLPTSVLAGP